jgi:hypothetical protein
MSSYPDDRYDDQRRDDGRPDSRAIERGRAAVGPPALLLILNGLFGLVVWGALSVPLVFDPDRLVRFFRNIADQQPAGQQKKDLEQKVDDMEKQVNQNRDAIALQNGVILSILGVLNVAAIGGGLMMRSLKSYGLSMGGAIVSIVPVATGCCCTGIPFGVWALVVLSRPEVKDAFAAARSSRFRNPDDQYMR